MKKILFLVIAVFAFCATAYAGNVNGRLPLDGSGNHAIQGFSPSATYVKSIGTGGKAVFKNFTTSGFTAARYTARSAAGVATSVKVRPGGFSTGTETDYFVSSGDVDWAPSGKIGFQAYSTATLINVHLQSER